MATRVRAIRAMSVGSDFYKTLITQFDAAVTDGSLKFSESTVIPEQSDGVSVLYTLVQSLKKKPTKADVELKKATSGKSDAQNSPWINPEESLVLRRNIGVGNKYMAVLNKFAVTKGHFLLVTNEFKRQESPLDEDDLESAFAVLREVNQQSNGTRFIGFFNSGANSGASIAHKHIQFLPLEASFSPFPDKVIEGKRPSDYEFKHGTVPLKCNSLDYAHFIFPIPVSATSGEDLAFIYSGLMARIVTMLSKNGHKDLAYNFAFTEEWMIAMPRTADQVEGRSINALGMIGMFLAKSDQDVEFFRHKGINGLMLALGLPEEEIDAKENDDTLGYTRY